MAIELSYGDDADQHDIDAAILDALGRKEGYVVQVTYRHYDAENIVHDVVIVTSSPAGLYVRAFDEESGQPYGQTFLVHAHTIDAIKIY